MTITKKKGKKIQEKNQKKYLLNDCYNHKHNMLLSHLNVVTHYQPLTHSLILYY